MEASVDAETIYEGGEPGHLLLLCPVVYFSFLHEEPGHVFNLHLSLSVSHQGNIHTEPILHVSIAGLDWVQPSLLHNQYVMYF